MAASGKIRTYAQLDAASNRGANLFRSLGLHPGHTIALLFDNTPTFVETCWAAQRAGLYFTPISTRLTLDEALYVLNDSDARVLIASSDAGVLAAQLAAARSRFTSVRNFFCAGGTPLDGAEDWSAATMKMSPLPIAGEPAGQPMIYSSGTTGRPKGVKRPLTGAPDDMEHPFVSLNRRLYRFAEDMIYLSPAPFYHSAPLVASMIVHRVGGTVVLMEHFTPEGALEAIERYHVTHAQMVPTMFVRLLKMPEEKRLGYDVASLRVVMHAAAPS
jgi:acyl-CoA synthetase (AMP-forming)/AMP-acid ligase II